MNVSTRISYNEARAALKSRWAVRASPGMTECPGCGGSTTDWEVGGFNNSRLYMRCEDCDEMESIKFDPDL